MRVLSQFSDNLVLSNNFMLIKIIRDIISYNNIEMDERILFSSTSFFSVKINEALSLREAFPLKLFIPDFIMENFSLHNKEQKKIIIDFLKIFINELIFLNYFVEMNKKIFTYTFSFQEKIINSYNFSNNRDILLLFGNYFTEKISVKEHIPKKIKNNKQFKLGENFIYSKYCKKNYLIGESFHSFLNRVAVSLFIHSYEFENLKKFLPLIGIDNLNVIFSCPNMRKLKLYKIHFIFEKNKCISVFSMP